MDPPGRAVGCDGGDGFAAVDGDALGFHRFGEAFAHVLVEAAQREVLADHEVDLGAQSGEDAGEFDGDIAAAEDDDAFGEVRQVEGIIGDDGVFGTGECGADRAAAGGDDDAFGGDGLAADIERVGVDEGRAGVEAGAGRHQALVGAVEAVDLLVFGGDQAGPVMPAGGDVPAEAGAVGRGGAVFGGHHQEFFRHAADVDAGAAPEAFLRHAHLGAMAGRHAGEADAARAAADDEDVKVVRVAGLPLALGCRGCHFHVPIPPRARYLISRYSSMP